MIAQTVKTFKARSSATDVLRAIGVPTRDYNLFIEPVDGGVACKIGLAQSHVEALKIQTQVGGGALVTTAAPKKSRRAVKSDPVGKSIAQTAAGITNALSDVGAEAAASAIVEAAEKAVTLVNPAAWPFPTTKALQIAKNAAEAGRGQRASDAQTSASVRATGQNGSTVVVPKNVAKNAGLKIHKDERPSKLNRADAAAFVKKSGSTPVTAPAKKADEKRTVSSVARALIVAGKTNEEVWDALVKEFKLDDSKKSYPAWYRRECKNKGLIK
jgi:hypothetical protein